MEGEISEDGTGTYNHAYILNSIDAMINDSDNKGMILYVDTPGGSVFASDELHLKIKEYQDQTGRYIRQCSPWLLREDTIFQPPATRL